ncbi:HGH motif RaS-RiPP peptide [Streptococcus intermedius]
MKPNQKLDFSVKKVDLSVAVLTRDSSKAHGH